jgi:hypothetical protein
MGSSYRADLRRGHVPEWEKPLREAVVLIQGVIKDSWDCLQDESQFDNAADDGAMRALLGVAVELIERELPKEKP